MTVTEPLLGVGVGTVHGKVGLEEVVALQQEVFKTVVKVTQYN
jgi:hypothetical protein